MYRINRIIIDLMIILLILIMPMWIIELLNIDVSLQKIITERKVEKNDTDEN